LKLVAETPGRQCDLVFDGAGLVMSGSDVGADVSQQPDHGRVVSRDQRGEAPYALLAGAVSQLTQQLGAQSPALPVIDDGDGNFGSLRVFVVPDVASDAQAAAVDVIQRPERLVVVVVDLGEITQLRLGQFRFARQEPQPSRLGTQPEEALGQERSVTGPDLSYQHV
jgi:hypothetical protein